MAIFHLGSAVYVLNVIPFAYFFWFAFGSKRHSIIGLYLPSNTRNYYKRWYVRMFFGRFQYTVYSIIAAYQIGKYLSDDKHNSSLDFTAFYHDLDLYDAEESDQAKRSLDRYLYKKMINNTRDIVLRERAEKDREFKIKAFDKYAYENNL